MDSSCLGVLGVKERAWILWGIPDGQCLFCRYFMFAFSAFLTVRVVLQLEFSWSACEDLLGFVSNCRFEEYCVNCPWNWSVVAFLREFPGKNGEKIDMRRKMSYICFTVKASRRKFYCPRTHLVVIGDRHW